MVDGSGLENRQGASPRGFESHPLRFSIADCGMLIADWRQEPARAEPGAENSEQRGADDVGEIMRRDIHARGGDEERDRGERQSPILGLTKRRTPKKPTVAAVWPLGKELYLELRRGPFQPSSCLTEGRARPVAILAPRATRPARAQARSIVRPMRTQRLLPRYQATATRSKPAITCSGQSPKWLTLRMNCARPDWDAR